MVVTGLDEAAALTGLEEAAIPQRAIATCSFSTHATQLYDSLHAQARQDVT